MPYSFKDPSAKRTLTESWQGGTSLKNFLKKISCWAGVEIGGARLSTEQSPPDKRLDTMFQRVIYHKTL